MQLLQFPYFAHCTIASSIQYVVTLLKTIVLIFLCILQRRAGTSSQREGDDELDSTGELALYNCLYTNVIAKIKTEFNNDMTSFNRLPTTEKNYLVPIYLHIVIDENSEDRGIAVADITT